MVALLWICKGNNTKYIFLSFIYVNFFIFRKKSSLLIPMLCPIYIYYACSYKVALEFKEFTIMIINIMISLSAGVSIFLMNFDWRNKSRKVALTVHVSYLFLREIIHSGFIWAFYQRFWESNDEWNTFRAACDIISIIISLFNSIQCTWMHIMFIYCTFNKVSKDPVDSCT